MRRVITRGPLRCGLASLVVLGMTGCLFEGGPRSRAWLDHFWGFEGPSGGDVVAIEVAILEQPLADPFLDSEVWLGVDEQVLPSERRMLLRDNGLRAGVVGGIVPAELQALLTSEGSNPHPRRFRERAGVPAEISLAGPMPACSVRWRPASAPEEFLELRDSEILLRITPGSVGGDRVRLDFQTVVRHGDAKLWRSPEEGGGLSLQGRQAERAFEELRWDVELRPNEYLVIGTGYEQAESFGHAALFAKRGSNLLQRLIVVRAVATNPPPRSEPLSREHLLEDTSVPLALQAHYGGERLTSLQRE